jgi:hypothetical protein
LAPAFLINPAFSLHENIFTAFYLQNTLEICPLRINSGKFTSDMPELQIPKGRYTPGEALHRGRVQRLKRAQSFHPDEQSDLRGLYFKHWPLPLDYDLNHHRTIPLFTTHYRISPRFRRTVSCDNTFNIHVDTLSFENDKYNTPPGGMRKQTENLVAQDTSREQGGGTNIRELAFDLDTLCEKCSGVNIESMTAAGGYLHLTLDVIKSQANTCRLCKVLFDKQHRYFREHTALDRYQIVLLLMTLPVHDHYLQWLHKAVTTRIVDTKPHEFLEPQRVKCHRKNFASDILCYTDEEDPAREAGVPWLRSIGHNTASAASLNVAKGWFEQCVKAETPLGFSKREHPAGGKKMKAPVEVDHAWGMPECVSKSEAEKFAVEGPTRLLFIVDPTNIENSGIRLVETHGTPHLYATLSYCWGKTGDEWQCKEHRLDQYLCHIDRETLPATIRDCLVIAATLSISYVWIDALCIIQDSASDWASESAKMGGIYHGSLLTIAAAASSHSDGGCFNTTSRPRFSCHYPREESYKHSDIVVLENILQDGSKSRLYFIMGKADKEGCSQDDIYDNEVVNGPLSKRAWVFQEQMLSRRVIYYAESQIFWDCEHCRLSEDNWPQSEYSQIYPIAGYDEPMSTSEIVEKWYAEAVEIYSARSLSHATDKLVAISAAAKATYLNRHVDYFAGLWKDCMMVGLIWERSSPGHKSTRYSCPSWSWASQETSVSYEQISFYYYRVGRGSAGYQPRVIDVKVETEPTSPFGDTKSGSITLDTLVTSGWLMRLKDKRRYPEETHRAFIFSSPDRTNIWGSSAVMDDDDYRGYKLTVALLGEVEDGWVALLLEPILGKSQTYRRVGILVPGFDRQVSCESLWRDSGVEPQRITIV